MAVYSSLDRTFDSNQEVLLAGGQELVLEAECCVEGPLWLLVAIDSWTSVRRLLEPYDILAPSETPVYQELASNLKTLDGAAAAQDHKRRVVSQKVDSDVVLQVVQTPTRIIDRQLEHYHVKLPLKVHEICFLQVRSHHHHRRVSVLVDELLLGLV